MSFVSTFKVRVEWEHVDPAYIVFYPQYLAWADSAAWAWFEQAGWPLPDMVKTYNTFGMPMLETHSRYMKAAKMGQWLTYRTRADKWEKRTWEMVHEVYDEAGDLCVEIWEKHVWGARDDVDPDRLRAGIIPDEVHEFVKRINAGGDVA